MQRFFYALTLLSLIFAVGCGGNTAVIKGTAKLKDGTPIDRGTVVFRNDKEQFEATIQPGGTFSPGKFKDGDGITPGVYQVYLMGVFPPPPPPMDGVVQIAGGPPASLIHEKYKEVSTSGITFDTSKQKTLDLVLDPPE
jgi:hypothetical protein